MFLHNKDIKGNMIKTLQKNNILFKVTSADRRLNQK